MCGIDADELRQASGAGHEADHVLRGIVGVDHQRSAGRHAAHVIPALDHGAFDQHDDVGLLVFVGEFVLDHVIAHAAILARGGVGTIGIVNIVLHCLRVLALNAGGGGDGVDDVASLFVHDDAARPNRKFRISHDQTSSLHSYSERYLVGSV